MNAAHLANGDSRGYWAAAGEGKLVFQRCRSCRSIQFPPRQHCATCWTDDLEQIESTGRGVIESLTVVRRAPTAAFRAKSPYAVVSVLVEEGPRMITNLVGEGALEAKIGDAVIVDFPSSDGGTVLPQFRLAA